MTEAAPQPHDWITDSAVLASLPPQYTAHCSRCGERARWFIGDRAPSGDCPGSMGVHPSEIDFHDDGPVEPVHLVEAPHADEVEW